MLVCCKKQVELKKNINESFKSNLLKIFLLSLKKNKKLNIVKKNEK